MADYITAAEGDAYAAAHLDATAWTSAPAARKSAAIAQATAEIDACRYQGCRYTATQERQFPRMIDATRMGVYPDTFTASAVWDWDSATNTAIVPPQVKRACFEQALFLLGDTEELRRLRARQQGLTGQSAGGVSESYAAGAKPAVTASDVLCQRAWVLLYAYRLRTGRLV